jgi:hypothetical protein
VEEPQKPRLFGDVLGMRRTEEVRREKLEHLADTSGGPLAWAQAAAGVTFLLIMLVVIVNIVR